MYLTNAVLDSLQSNLTVDVLCFLPELILCGGIVLFLLLRLFPRFDRTHLGLVAFFVTLAALVFSVIQWQIDVKNGPEVVGVNEAMIVSGGMWELGASSAGRDALTLFNGLIAFDNFTVFLRMFLFGFTILVIWLSMLTGIPDREDSADFYCLLLGATVGMSLMASANHLLMVYIGVEMASLPSYALAGFLKGRRKSSEAALKYVVYGGGASGVMLYGISLLAGKFGTGYLPNVASGYVALLQHGSPGATQLGYDPILLLGTLFILVGIAFKLASVPFHFWCPDVFEGAPAEIGGYLSVASKGAALALLGRFSLMLTGLGGNVDFAQWASVAQWLGPALAFFAALTATFGNLAAYPQTNLKRLLAYSTIAHAGYMMMGLAPLNRAGASAVLFYLVAYLFMNLGAFAVVAFLRNQTGSEDLSSYRGLVRRSPWMVVTLCVFLLSLLGMPPLAGFVAKFQIFQVLFDSGQAYRAAGKPVLGNTMYALLVIGGLNTVISLVYYLKVMKIMILDRPLDEVEGQEPVPLREPAGTIVYVAALAVMIGVVGIYWNPLAEASEHGVQQFRTPANVKVALPGSVGEAERARPPAGSGTGRLSAPGRLPPRPGLGRPGPQRQGARGAD